MRNIKDTFETRRSFISVFSTVPLKPLIESPVIRIVLFCSNPFEKYDPRGLKNAFFNVLAFLESQIVARV